MKLFIAFLFLAFLPMALLASTPKCDLIPADDAHIQYSGRIDFTNPKAPRFDWPGVSITVRFSGKSVGFRLEDGNNNYNLTVDGKPVSVWVTKAGKPDCLVTGLSDGEHTIVLSKRTEGYFGTATFKGVLLAKGSSLLDPPSKPTRRIEFIGDSWTCGYGNEGPGIKCGSLRPLENNDLAFGAVAAKILGAERHIVAYSGRGLVRNYGEKKTESDDPIGVYFGRTLVNDSSSHWDFQSWVPDVVVIKLGVNDFSSKPESDIQLFKTRYLELLKRVRTAYPKAWIVSYDATGWPNYNQYVYAAMEDFKNQGDARLLILEHAPFPTEENGCDYHPNVKAHQRMGEDLAARIGGLWDEKASADKVTPTATPKP